MDAKRLLRSRLLAARAARPAAEIAAAEATIAEHGTAAWRTLGRVAAYAAIGTEPPTRALLERLHALDVSIVLPVVTDTELRWTAYVDWVRLVPGPLGLLQPEGPPVAGDALAGVDAVIVPALAVDRRGNRLGRGKGYYDRALTGIETARVVAVVYDDEVLDDLPTEEHDQQVGAVLTPSGLRRLGG